MPTAPNSKNYTLGKGRLYFDLLDPDTGLYVGERHMGNAPALTFNTSLSFLAHYLSTGGLKSKDVNMPLEITPKFKITLDEPNGDNLGLMFLSKAEKITQSANDNQQVLLTDVKPGFRYPLNQVNVGIFAVKYKTGTAAFTVGRTLTAGAATATIVRVIGNTVSGTLYIKGITGTFADGVALSDNTPTTPGAALVDGTQYFVDTACAVADTDVPATFFTAGVDYTLDATGGAIIPLEGGAINGTTVKDLTVTFASKLTTYKQLNAMSIPALEGRVRYVSDNPKGNQYEMLAWRVQLAPSGDVGFISDTWLQMALDGEVLKDEINHPECPFIQVKVFDAV